MTIYPILKLKYPFHIVTVDGQTQAVPTGGGAQQFHGIILLQSDSARFMFEKLLDGITLPDLIYACLQRYDASTVEEAGPIVLEFLDTLKARHLLVADTSRGVRVNEP